MECENRVVVLIDMDCFYCQVEEKLNPELEGKPIAVVQYNPWKGGGIIAVNYIARAMGVTRHMRGDEAKEKCPEIQLPSVPCSRGKADITKYREAGKDVARVLQKFTPLLERASIDEAYLDITQTVQKRLETLNVNTITPSLLPNTFALGYDNVDQFISDVHSCGSDSIDFDYEHARRLLVAAVIVSEVRAAVYEETGYQCSAGIAHNKILAKLVCGMNKPNKQTILPTHSINILYKTLPLKKVKHLGGKFGYTVCELLKVTTMAELQTFTEKQLQNKFDEKNGTWLYNIARGIDLEPVQARFNPKSIGCCKQFRGKAALLTVECLRKWLKDLGDEIEDRLEQDALETNRSPKQMVVSYALQPADGRDATSSRSYNFLSDDDLCGDFFYTKALDLVMESAEGIKVKDGEANRKLKAPIKFLGISVGKFEDHSDAKKTKNIKDYFAVGSSKTSTVRKEDDKKDKCTKKDTGKEYILQKFFQISEKTVSKNIAEEANTLSVLESAGSSKTSTVRKEDDKKDKCTKKDTGKEYILQKFFQISEKTVSKNIAKEANTLSVLESSLDKQESFFAKMLSKKIEVDNRSIESDSSHTVIANKPSTPVCEITDHGEDSNDTEYSSSTINNEINKSIALFDDEPTNVDRITNIRELLKSTLERNLEKAEATAEEKAEINEPDNKIQDQQVPVPTMTEVDTFRCPECGKHISIDMVEMHSDYHMALKMREEEREQVRKEKKTTKKENNAPPPKQGKKKKVLEEKTSKTDTNTKSITSFLVKICDSTVTQTCTECGKKVAVEKMVEHLDFHEAQKLSRELNHHHKPSIFQSNSTTKRKRSTSPVKKQKIPKCKSIDSFFKVT